MNDEMTDSLIIAAQNGDDEAAARLVTENAALVKSIVKKYLNRGVEYDDLYQLGCMGLVKCIKNFNISYNVKFSTYAVPMIAGEIKRFLRDDGMIKVSRTLKELAVKVNQAQRELAVKLGREASLTEISAHIGADQDEIIMALEAARPPMSIFEPIYTDDADTLVMDRVEDGGNAMNEAVNRVILKELLGTLEPKERQLIVLRYFKDMTQSQVAKLMGISQVQVSRLEIRIMEKLRKKA